MGDFTPHRVRGSGQSDASAGISMLSCSFDDFRKEAEGFLRGERRESAKARQKLKPRYCNVSYSSLKIPPRTGLEQNPCVSGPPTQLNTITRTGAVWLNNQQQRK